MLISINCVVVEVASDCDFISERWLLVSLVPRVFYGFDDNLVSVFVDMWLGATVFCLS